MPETIIIAGKTHKLFFPKQAQFTELFRNLILDDEYMLKTLPKEKIKNVLDIGANIGMFCLAARVHFPKAVIHAYEANIALKKYLDRQAAALRADVFYEAIGRQDGLGQLRNSATLTAASVAEIPKGSVTVTSFAKAVSRFENEIDLLKLDCEGMEWQLFKDPRPWQRCKYVTMEYHLGQGLTPELACEKLRLLGFRVTHFSKRTVMQGNILAMKES